MMILLIYLFAGLTMLAGAVIIINPDVVFGYLRRNIDKPAIHLLAVVVRLIIGALLISQSALSRFPLTIEILGWISVGAALTLAVIGRSNFRRLMNWALTRFNSISRVGGFLACAFGGFLIYSFL